MAIHPIPKQLQTKTDILGIGVRQVVEAGAFIVLALIFFGALPFSEKINGIIALIIVGIGFIVILFKIDDAIIALLNYSKSLHNISYFDPKMDKFIDIKQIKYNSVFLKNSKILSIIRVEPIDMSIFDDEEQENIIEIYRGFLRSLSYPIQIMSRSVAINIDSWLYNMERRIKKNKSINQQAHLERFRFFQDWITNLMTGSVVRNRLFYIVIPYTNIYEGVSTLEVIGTVLREMIFGKKLKLSEKLQDKALKELSDRTQDAISRLRQAKLNATRLKDNELLSLFAGYFTDVGEDINLNYVTPIMFEEELKEEI